MDKEKMDEIYRENAQSVYKYLCSLTRDSRVAEELTQETFFQAIKGIDKFKGDCKISVWLCGIAKKLWYKELERKKRHQTAPLDDTIPSRENVENKSLDHLEKIEIFRLMHNLDDITREVMYLRLAGELQFSEIANILGKTENWARVTYYRGKQKIMKGMKEWTEN
ncbi:MAG: RNA polymerase sigma factor [Blautia sp.]|nr:RNA polymerase sigma factor [Lachnoclostridium sp.]MCM1210304.1 RNA polymerase sigma factor [Blautia sp.]